MGKKIVLVEDNFDHAELIIEVFKENGIVDEVVLIKDGQKALDYFQRRSADDSDGKLSEINLIILDINLPRVNGTDILKFLKRDLKYSSIPVIVLSTTSDSETITEAYRYGADDFITKHISYEEFIENIKILKKFYNI